MVRQRSRPGQGPGKAKRSLCRKDSSGSVSENPIGKEEGLYINNLSTYCIIVHCQEICVSCI